jgi:FixJ family two-component response regulator
MAPSSQELEPPANPGRFSLPNSRHQPDDGSGIELTYRLKADGVSVPVIYMTGNDSLDVQKLALASGCIALLKKPFSAQELIGHLKRAAIHPDSGAF